MNLQESNETQAVIDRKHPNVKEVKHVQLTKAFTEFWNIG